MRLPSIQFLRRACVAVLPLISSSATVHGQDISLKKELVWSLPGSEIASPKFSADGKFVVLVSRTHWPDGAEAEGLPDAFLEKFGKRKQQEPRFADPIIRLIDLKGNPICEIRYGTSPSIAVDNKSIVFSRQKNPITGLRPLAATQAGNDIQIFDCEKKQARTIAEPQTGYLDNPVFLPDGRSIAYSLNDAVNGEMGGSVGIERIDVNGTHKDSLLDKEATPAISCQSAGSTAMTQLQTMMKLSSSFPTLVRNSVITGNELLILEAKPIPSAGDIYLASNYELNLVSLIPKKHEVFSMGPAAMDALWKTSLQPLGDSKAMIFSGYWKTFSLETKELLNETAQLNANFRSIYSPNGRYFLAVEPRGEEPRRFALYSATDGKRLFTSATMAQVFDVTWTADASRFAVVTLPKGLSGAAYREVLTVYSLQ
jgi:hypothetical protein